jgi:two-component system OmpR family sensor kinase
MTTTTAAVATMTVTMAEAPSPAPRRRLVISARLRIMGWLLLLMAVVSLTVILVTRALLLQQFDSRVRHALEQEAREFHGVASGGVDRATKAPFADVHDLLYNHLHRQQPDDAEVLVGWVKTAGGEERLGQQRTVPFPLHRRPDVLDPILQARDNSGTTHTDAGEMRWIKVVATGPAGASDRGVFVVGYLVDGPRTQVDQTVRTLALVSAAGVLLVGGVAWLVAGQLLAPVRLVRRAAAQITEQDLTRRIPVHGRDDIAALADQFNAMLDRLEAAFGTQRQFLDDASHELRTPITIIRGHLELLDPADDPTEHAATIRLCTDELDRMSRIVADLLVLAEADRPDFAHPEPVEVAELTSDVYAKVHVLGEREWRLESIGEGVAYLDQQRVTQAVVQLAQNAVQHTRPGDRILLGSSVLSGTVSFWITDTGPGVAEQDAKKIFDRFSRGSSGPRHRTGAGLGLAIVSAIAQAHGGSAKLVSTPGQGATFGIELPQHGAT